MGTEHFAPELSHRTLQSLILSRGPVCLYIPLAFIYCVITCSASVVLGSRALASSRSKSHNWHNLCCWPCHTWHTVCNELILLIDYLLSEGQPQASAINYVKVSSIASASLYPLPFIKILNFLC